MKRSIVLLGLFSAMALAAQTDVVKYGVGTQGKDYGVTYALPKTVINIEVEADRVTYTPGEFVRYADRYLRLSGISGEAEEYWEIKNIRVTSVGVPDPENAYFVKMKDKTLAPLVELTREGIISSINYPLESSRTTDPEKKEEPAKRRVNPRDFMTEEILMAGSTAKMAELVAKEIYNIRESKNSLVRGQADNMPQDGQSLKLMLDNLEEQETALTEMFSGVTSHESRIFNIQVNPGQGVEKQVLFRFSRRLGVVGSNNLAGEPIYLDLTDLRTVNVADDGKGKKKLEGIAYNVPGKARVTVYDSKKKYAEEELPVTQFGVVEYLAPSMFEKKSVVQVKFDTSTGGLIKVDRQ
ncbi:MAG: DUF4831 family protein [Bacteroides sp.]|nr:DUF4831 family protein [Bacteroides sp.]